MEQIKRANRLYTNDSIFLKKSLSIPVLSEMSFGPINNGEDACEDEESCPKHSVEKPAQSGAALKPSGDDSQRDTDLSPMDYLKRLDSLITQSKQAAAETCREDKMFTFDDPVPPTRLSRSRSQFSALHSRPGPSQDHRSNTPAPAGSAVPITVTRRTKKLREKEDEIFQL